MTQFMPTHAESMSALDPTTARLFGPGGIFHPSGGPAPATPATPPTPGVPGTPTPVAAPHPLLTRIWALIQQGQAAGFPKIKQIVSLLISSGILGTSGSGFLSTLLGILNGLSGTLTAPTMTMQTSASLIGSLPISVDWTKFDELRASVSDAHELAMLDWIKKELS